MSLVSAAVLVAKQILGLKPYEKKYFQAKINPGRLGELKDTASKILEGRMRYELVARALGNGIPWWFIGITHFMEAGAKYPKHFNYHLHCGDPLTGRTFHVPKGRPVHNPGHGTQPPGINNPYSWEESALDALRFIKYDKVTDWSLENCLVLFEKFNGTGYKKRGVPSPYLWSFTDQYTSGKYVADGVFDKKVVSKQAGTAAIMKALGV